MNQIFQTAKILMLALVLSLGLSYVYAWTAPTATPPSGNVSTPINIGETAQTKAGSLIISATTTSKYFVDFDNLSLSNPAYFVKPTGESTFWDVVVADNLTTTSLRIPGGTEGQVLMSEGDGNAYWYSKPVTTASVTGLLTALAPATVAAGSGAMYSAVSSDGRFVYVTNFSANTISMYSRDTATGKLSPLSTPTISTGSQPTGIGLSPNGDSVYVSNRNSNSISMYSRNPITGILTALSPSPTIAAGANPWSAVVSPDGKSVYAANYTTDNVSQYSRDITTGALIALSPANAGFGAVRLVISPIDGAFVYVTNFSANTISQYSRNLTTGALSALPTPTIGTGSGPADIIISPDGISVYVANYGSSDVSQYSRNTTNGQLTKLTPATIDAGTTGSCSISLCGNQIAISSDGSSVYATNVNSGTIYMYSRDTTTGLLTALSPAYITAGVNPWGTIVSPDGESVYVANRGSDNVSQYFRD